MLQRIEVTSAQGALLNLPLEDLDNGFLLEEVEGLDPVKATITTSSFAQLDGSEYQFSRREERNIKLKISLEPDWGVDTVRTLRKKLYEYFMPKSLVTLTFYTSDGLPVDIMGRVESFESPLFTNTPAVDISILCFNPDFYSQAPSSFDGSTTQLNLESSIVYDGSIETGLVFTLFVNRTLPEFTFYHYPPDGSFHSLEFSTPLIAGDVLTISTISGDKGATLNRASVASSVLYGISPQSDWIELMPGINRIRVYSEGAPIPFHIEYANKYGGL